MNRDVARGQDIGKGGVLWEWGGLCVCGWIMCVCFMCLYCLSSSCVLCTQCYQSIHSRQKFQLTYWGKKYLLFIIDDQHFSKFFLFPPLIFESSSDCGPFLICTSVFSQAPGSRIFFFIKISYLECMFNFRTPWHVLLLF